MAWKDGPCEYRVAGKPGAQHVLLVRCKCLGRYSPPLGEARTPHGARELWDEHVRERAGEINRRSPLDSGE